MSLSPSQIQSYKNVGFLIIRNALSRSEVADIQQWAVEVHDTPMTADNPMMPYEEINASGKRVLCRTENFASSHEGFNMLLRGEQLLGILEQISGEKMFLFKEKINYKLSGSGGFSPHLDATAYTHIKDVKHLTVLLAVDAANKHNGGLEVVPGSNEMAVPIGEDNCIDNEWVRSQQWTPVELEPGDFLIFGSYLAHRSGPNDSPHDRKAIYATYNAASEGGDMHDSYYADRRVHWPPTHLRKEGEAYEKGALRYGFGSPMLSVATGKRFEG